MNTSEWAAQLFKVTPRATRDDFPSVVLDLDATQKFVEIQVLWEFDNPDASTVLIRGLESAERHWDAAATTFHQLQECFLYPKVVGGGRIKHDSVSQTILIYGSSVEYGQANFERVMELCREAFPGYSVSYHQSGY